MRLCGALRLHWRPMEAGRAFEPHCLFSFPHDLVRVPAELFQQPRHDLQSRSPEGHQCCESERYKAVKETATLFMVSVSFACAACVSAHLFFISTDNRLRSAVHWAEAILANNSMNPIHLKRKGEPRLPNLRQFGNGISAGSSF